MKTMLQALKYIAFIIVSIGILTSCEDVIELELDTSEQRIVIEGNLNADLGECVVEITKTGDFYETDDFEGISGAVVNLNLSSGASYLLVGDGTGAYRADNILIQPNETADLSIALSSGEVFTASTVCPTPTVLDSLELEEVEGFFTEDVFYQLFYNFQDPANVDNYYRTKVSVNNSLISGYILLNDEAQDGEDIRIPFFGPPFEAADTLDVELLMIDKESYEYFVQLDDAISQGLGAGVPYNPKGNFDQDILGYFGISYSSTMRIIAPE